MPNDEIIIIKPKYVISPMWGVLTATKLREIADAIDAGEMEVKCDDTEDPGT